MQETQTDNAAFTPGDRVSDLVTRPLLSLDAKLDDGRAQAQVNGSLGYDFYARLPAKDGWYAAGNASASYSVVPDLLTLKAAGSTSVTALSAFGRSATDRPGAGQNVQLTTYAIGPELTERTLDGLTVTAAARFAQVFYANASDSPLPIPDDDSIVQLTASASSDAARRLQLQSSVEYLRDAHDFTSITDVQSAYFRVGGVRLIGRVGYDDVTRGQLLRVSAPLVSAGLEYRPNSNSTITVETGVRYSKPVWAVQAKLDLSPRLVAIASYSEEVEPDQVGVARSFFAFGEAAQNLPPPLVPASFGVSGDLTDTTSLSRSARIQSVYDDGVNTIDVTADWTDRELLTTPGRDRTVGVDARVSRRVHPDLTLIVRANYARTLESQTYTPSQSLGGAVEIAYKLNSRTDLTLAFSHTQNRQFDRGNEQITENAFVESLTRSF